MIRSWRGRASCAALWIAVLWATSMPGRAAAQDLARAAAEPGLTLFEVYRLAAERNPRVAAARSLAAAVAARQPGASVLPDPSLQLAVMNLSLPSMRADMPTSMAPSVQLMQMVPFPGKLGLSGHIAETSTAMAQADAAEAWWEVRSAAAMAFYELYEADQQIAVMRETLGLLEDFAQVAKAMYSAGEGRQSDVLRASVEVARMDAEVRRMQALRVAAAARLNGILNRPAATLVPTPELGALPLAVPGADTLLAWAHATRPMLERNRLGVDQAGAQRDLAKREIWPDVVVGVQYGQRRGDMGTERMGSAMLGFSLPIFASKRQLRMRDEAAAMEQMAKAELMEMETRVDARIGELLANIERDRTLVRLYRTDVLPQADANVQSAFSSYRVGTVDFMTLVDARMTVNRYAQELYALLADYGRTLADLEMTIGRELPRTSLTLTEDR